MTKHVALLFILFGSVALVWVVGCDREVPTGKAGAQNDPAASTGQTPLPSFDSVVKTPLDKARGVETTLEKGAERTADTVNGATHGR